MLAGNAKRAIGEALVASAGSLDRSDLGAQSGKVGSGGAGNRPGTRDGVGGGRPTST